MRQTSARGKRLRALMLIGILVSLAVLFSLQGLFVLMVRPIAIPLIQAGTWISDRVFWWQKSNEITSDALKDLYEDREQFALLAKTLQQAEEENRLLKEEIAFLERTRTAGVPARVVSKSLSQSVNHFVIDRGSDDGVIIGAAVVSGDGILVGKVIDVGKASATVSALTDPDHAVAVSLLNESRTIGLATGTFGGLVKIDFIPTDEEVLENDLVVTSGLESLVPSGLLVGIVNTVEQQVGSPFQQAIIEPLVDFRLISLVIVLTPTGDTL